MVPNPEQKQHTRRNVAAGRREGQRERTRESGDFQKKLAISCRAGVARRKRNAFRKIRSKGNCGAQKKLVAACMKITRRTGLTLQGTQASETRQGRCCSETPERTDGRGRRPLCLRRQRTTAICIRRWNSGQRSHLGRARTLEKNLYEFCGLIVKQMVFTALCLGAGSVLS